MEELTLQEIMIVNGGSPESYANGERAGQAVRDIIDDAVFIMGLYAIAAAFLF